MVRKTAPRKRRKSSTKEQAFLEKYKDYAIKFGKHLRKLRKERKLSQEDLAKRAGCNISFVGSVERGQKSPTLLTLSKIADGLGIHITKLFDIADERDAKRELKETLEDRFFAILAEGDEETLKMLNAILKGILELQREKTKS